MVFSTKGWVPKDMEGLTKCVDPDQTALLIWVCTVCTDLPVPIFRTLKVNVLFCTLLHILALLTVKYTL